MVVGEPIENGESEDGDAGNEIWWWELGGLLCQRLEEKEDRGWGMYHGFYHGRGGRNVK